ncbi:ChbG/HpnK family deacetylase [Piscinibacter terrae]|uniref:ChbG/HpnK family deacetylase n=1 Tax=Piscinibacter terrae TaxID=2496871 RepID=A0A3N7IY51_9BURK|nr:ChbG/HpnK family deacetylase [Albitalea terrae]RQP23682.1 ChbG/HpnK family deacetylase [Albitalea terrae]
MSRQTFLRRLGLAAGERAVVLHADDIGLGEASVRAYAQIHQAGLLGSASVMVPSGWFPAVADLARSGVHDLGVHLTLNSEWPNYRMAPLLGPAAASLADAQGWFHPLAVHTHRHASADEAFAELSAQVRRARTAGLAPTHIDSHMLTLLHPTLFEVYVRLSRQERLPATLIRMDADQLERLCRIPRSDAVQLHERLQAVDEEGLVAFDTFAELPLDAHDRRLDAAHRILDGLPEGLAMFICHPACDGVELRAMTTDWAARAADHRLYLDDGWRRAIESSGIRTLNMRQVRDAMFP